MINGFSKTSRRRQAYRRLFLDEHDQLKPEAVAVLEDLYEHVRFFKNVAPEPQTLAVVEGGRAVVRHIVKQINIVDQEIKRRIAQGVHEDI